MPGEIEAGERILLQRGHAAEAGDGLVRATAVRGVEERDLADVAEEATEGQIQALLGEALAWQSRAR